MTAQPHQVNFTTYITMITVKETYRSIRLLMLVALVGSMYVFVPEQQPSARQDFNQLPKTENQ